MRIISRSEWGARPPKSVYRIPTPTAELWLHHTAGGVRADKAAVREIQRFHQDSRGWSDIAYSFLVGGGGLIYEGRGWGIAGGHTAGRNTISHAICVIGNYEQITPAGSDLEAVAWLMAEGQRRGQWGTLTGAHRDAPGAKTQCCGRHLIQQIPWLRERAAEFLSPSEDDMLRDFIEAAYGAYGIAPDVDVKGKAYWWSTAAQEAPRRHWTYADCLASPTLAYMVSLLHRNNAK